MVARLIGCMSENRMASGRCEPAHARLAIVLLAALVMAPALGAPPLLYRTPGMQSPVRTGPGELLLLGGANLSADNDVVLRADSGQIIAGVEVIRAASDEQALVLRTPEQLDANQAYSIAVNNRDGSSIAVALNDARPGWLTPDSLPTAGAPPGLAREVKIVGRNLKAAGIPATLVRLRGPRTVLLKSLAASERAQELDEFVTRVVVPALPRGAYSVALSRDGKHWVDLPMPLRIEPVPAPKAELPVESAEFGACRADDERDDTPCIVAAIAAAQRRGGGIVRFGEGKWQIDEPGVAGVSAGEGIVVPRGVDLAGNAARGARLVRGPKWRQTKADATFTLLGDNTVTGLALIDDTRLRESKDDPVFLRVGRTWQRVGLDTTAAERITNNVVITNNQFAGSAVSVADGGMPIRRLVITNNMFRAYRLALAFAGSSHNVRDVYRVEDSVIARNVFEPGSYLDSAIGQGTRATEFGAAERMDFSENLANGAALGGLDSPADARGWRAAFFWHLQGPQEQLLIADNDVSCSGDKAGDGEAIALDANHNTFALTGALGVLTADANSVGILGPVAARQGRHAIDTKTFYVGHWLQISDGRGVGQSRRIVALDYEPQSRRTTFRVAPAWDVVPMPADSRVVVGRAFWQTFVVGNRIDHRQPLCRKSNRTAPRGGAILMWAQSSDSVIAFNRQFDTNGIGFQQMSNLAGTTLQSFLEIRGNKLTGEYTAGRADSQQGIWGSHGASPDQPPPVAGFGVLIAVNEITAADNARGPAISLPATWYRGPAPHDWTVIDRMLIYKNEIRGGGTGVEIVANALARRSVLLSNRCAGVARPMTGSAPQIVLLCPVRDPGYCECGAFN